MKKVFLFLVLMGFMSNVYSTTAVVPAATAFTKFLEAASKTPEGIALLTSYIKFYGAAGVIKSTGNLQKGLALLANSKAFRKEFFKKNPQFFVEKGTITSSFTDLPAEITSLSKIQELALQAKALKEDPNCLNLLAKKNTSGMSETMKNLRALIKFRIQKEIKTGNVFSKKYKKATKQLALLTKKSEDKFKLLNKKTRTKADNRKLKAINKTIEATQKYLNTLPIGVLARIRLNNTRDFIKAVAREAGLNGDMAYALALQNGALAIKEGPLPKEVEKHLIEVAAQLEKSDPNFKIDLSNPEDVFKAILIGYSPHINAWLMEQTGGIGQLSGSKLSEMAKTRGGAPLGMRDYFERLVSRSCKTVAGIAKKCKEELFPLIRKSGICATARIGI